MQRTDATSWVETKGHGIYLSGGQYMAMNESCLVSSWTTAEWNPVKVHTFKDTSQQWSKNHKNISHICKRKDLCNETSHLLILIYWRDSCDQKRHTRNSTNGCCKLACNDAQGQKRRRHFELLWQKNQLSERSRPRPPCPKTYLRSGKAVEVLIFWSRSGSFGNANRTRHVGLLVLRVPADVCRCVVPVNKRTLSGPQPG